MSYMSCSERIMELISSEPGRVFSFSDIVQAINDYPRGSVSVSLRRLKRKVNKGVIDNIVLVYNGDGVSYKMLEEVVG